MYDMIHEELLDAVGIEDREWLAADDIHPYKSLVPKSKSNTVSFPKITKFNTYLLQHYGAEIVGELNEMMYDGQLAGVVGVDGFHTQRLTRDKCRIDPRMSFWRRNQIEFIADIVVYLNVSVYRLCRPGQRAVGQGSGRTADQDYRFIAHAARRSPESPDEAQGERDH